MTHIMDTYTSLSENEVYTKSIVWILSLILSLRTAGMGLKFNTKYAYKMYENN